MISWESFVILLKSGILLLSFIAIVPKITVDFSIRPLVASSITPPITPPIVPPIVLPILSRSFEPKEIIVLKDPPSINCTVSLSVYSLIHRLKFNLPEPNSSIRPS